MLGTLRAVGLLRALIIGLIIVSVVVFLVLLLGGLNSPKTDFFSMLNMLFNDIGKRVGGGII